jgi:hypothetical protein
MNINDIWKDGVAKHIQGMTQHERLSLRQTHCGSFERALIEAWFKADMVNKNILEEAFKNTNFKLT